MIEFTAYFLYRLENFVFETEAKNSQIKLIDFGLSKRYSGGGIKRMKTMVGTSYYMAPEVLNEYISYTNVSVLFLLLTARFIFNFVLAGALYRWILFIFLKRN